MLASMFFAAVLVLLTVLLHYEALRLVSLLLPKLTIPVRARIIVVVVGAFCAHTAEVWLYAIAYALLAGRFGIGTIGGTFGGHFEDYLYFSAVTYTSLGLGDVYPLGGLRLLAGVEALNGLVLIAWSASFTYLAMERLWNLRTRG
ncbi:MAG: two pore domain potassium channel family protein [Ectothiorhodospiraceae bacterium]|nr:two pore domain potassium channel family protein [Chromatiales bacterium]MCP5154692.1 two pore domain potassium channel family protein [Ectothiorhodospiraceae bacterium]